MQQMGHGEMGHSHMGHNAHREKQKARNCLRALVFLGGASLIRTGDLRIMIP